MRDNTFTENAKTNAEQLGKIRISNVNNASAETTFSDGARELNRKPSQDNRRVSEPESNPEMNPALS
jgi:hypothetical protein